MTLDQPARHRGVVCVMHESTEPTSDGRIQVLGRRLAGGSMHGTTQTTNHGLESSRRRAARGVRWPVHYWEYSAREAPRCRAAAPTGATVAVTAVPSRCVERPRVKRAPVTRQDAVPAYSVRRST